jgi:sugar/nucleoside kinase (ribokinase family)
MTAGGVLCSGNIVYDTLVHPVAELRWGTSIPVETIETHIGGNGANTSVALATIGTPVRLVGAVGCDEQGRFVLDVLRRAGVDTDAVRATDAPTAATVALVNSRGERTFLHRMGASAKAFAEPIAFAPPLTDGISHYHLASIFMLPNLRPIAGETLARARAAGLATSLDTNWDPRGRWMEDLGPCLPHLDIVFINEDEARMATGSGDSKTAAHVLLARGARVAVMKLGARGCAIYGRGEEIVCPAFDVQAKDTTGAGDCFVAGFLAALIQGRTPAEAGHFANAVGALSVQRVGGVAGVPPFESIERWMRTARLRQTLPR